MYKHYLRDMPKSLASVGLVENIDRAEEVLVNYWTDKIAIVWNVEDVKLAIVNWNENATEAISDRIALKVLQTVFDRHNCNYGINWNIILTTFENLEKSSIASQVIEIGNT